MSLTIVPKIDENWEVRDGLVLKQIKQQGKLEIQMLNKNYLEQFDKCSEIIKSLQGIQKLDTVILHLPLGVHDIDYVIVNTALRYNIGELFRKADKLGSKLHIFIYVLFHTTDEYYKLVDLGGLEFIKDMLNMTRNVGILIENSIRSLRVNPNQKIQIDLLFDNIQYERVSACFDICHLQAQENALWRKYSLQESFIDNIKTVHFSYTANNDGYRDKSTHGIAHRDIDEFEKDLEYLKEKWVDINKVWLVLEVQETDYINRPNLCKEIELAKLADSRLEEK